MSGARWLVRGRVQGVAFRAHAQREAERLALTGRARNLDDGRVEVIAFGDAASIDAFARWLAHGPPHARVDGVDGAPLGDAVPASGFTIG